MSDRANHEPLQDLCLDLYRDKESMFSLYIVSSHAHRMEQSFSLPDDG